MKNTQIQNIKWYHYVQQNINKLGVVGRLLHGMLYPAEEKVDVEKFLTLFSKEVIIARLLFMLYNEKRDETSVEN